MLYVLSPWSGRLVQATWHADVRRVGCVAGVVAYSAELVIVGDVDPESVGLQSLLIKWGYWNVRIQAESIW